MDFGWFITLQECQKHSFAYLRRVLGDRMPPNIIDPTIANLQPESFAVILALSLTYAFDRPAYPSFLADARRIPNRMICS
jgi:hypothetical protein